MQISDMIPGVNIIRERESIASDSEAGGPKVFWDPKLGVLGGGAL